MRTVFVAAFAACAMASMLSPSTASADILISDPPRQRVQGDGLWLGVWYQSYSGGPNTLRAQVYFAGRKVADRRLAATTRWRQHFLCGCDSVGTYRLRITGAGWNHTYRVRMRSEGV